MAHTPSRAGFGASRPGVDLTSGTSSFTDVLRARAPHLLPGGLGGRPGERPTDRPGRPPGDQEPVGDTPEPGQEPVRASTVVAVTFLGGVLVAGDRRATAGHRIVREDLDPVLVTDASSAVGVTGPAALGLDLVRRFAVELAHHEKVEGVPLSLDARTNRLAALLRAVREPAASTGLAVLPLFVGLDLDADDPDQPGRIVSFDELGGRYAEHAGHHAVGSGAPAARSALRASHDPDGDVSTAVRTALAALRAAADDDAATGGPDLARHRLPTIVTVTAAGGAGRVPDEQVAAAAETGPTDRADRPRG